MCKVKKRYLIYKNCGESLREALDRLKTKNKELLGLPLTYAGRLDPLAEGLLLVLAGNECKHKEAYLNLEKIYEFSMILGFSTDSYDLLGLVQEIDNEPISIKKNEIEKVNNFLSQKHVLPYPPYSSKTILGTPLWMLTRSRKITEHSIPKREMNVIKTRFLGSSRIHKTFLKKVIEKKVGSVTGDFRQGEILKTWNKIISDMTLERFPILHFRIRVSSGTYVRSLVHEVGRILGVPATTFSIKRVSVGPYRIKTLHKKM